MVEATPIEALQQDLKILGDENRLRILQHLQHGTCCVCQLQQHLQLPLNLLSHHLRVLKDAGFVTSHKRGRWVDYTLQPGRIGRTTHLLSSLGRIASEGEHATHQSTQPTA